jgi:hypothetical protein
VEVLPADARSGHLLTAGESLLTLARAAPEARQARRITHAV